MKQTLTWIVAIALLLVTGAGGVAAASTRGGAPPGDTVVDVTGDARNGFEIWHYDGTGVFPPTGSEARAECSEYDRRVDRVRCRVEVRTWYRDLADLKQALDWAHRQAAAG
ncbi:hypothetical protein [Nocardioides sp.]|uniref:hypothetical protein n=1 Tax=Nocardioides sp. TaxID=35761 RepID=UPI00378384D9